MTRPHLKKWNQEAGKTKWRHLNSLFLLFPLNHYAKFQGFYSKGSYFIDIWTFEHKNVTRPHLKNWNQEAGKTGWRNLNSLFLLFPLNHCAKFQEFYSKGSCFIDISTFEFFTIFETNQLSRLKIFLNTQI